MRDDQPLEQHDDHCWLNIGGESAYLRALKQNPLTFYYTYGYHSRLFIVSFDWFNFENYCNQAVRNLYSAYPTEMRREKSDT